MARLCAPLALTGAQLLALPLVGSADPPTEEIIPAPRPLAAPVLPRPIYTAPGYLPPVPPQFGQRSVWQFYSVDRTGRFRLLVVPSPHGDYYRYNLAPYPWANVNPRSQSANILGTTLFPRVGGPPLSGEPILPGPALGPAEAVPPAPLMPYALD